MIARFCRTPATPNSTNPTASGFIMYLMITIARLPAIPPARKAKPIKSHVRVRHMTGSSCHAPICPVPSSSMRCRLSTKLTMLKPIVAQSPGTQSSNLINTPCFGCGIGSPGRGCGTGEGKGAGVGMLRRPDRMHASKKSHQPPANSAPAKHTPIACLFACIFRGVFGKRIRHTRRVSPRPDIVATKRVVSGHL